MSTTPPPDQPPTEPSVRSGPAWGNMPDVARLPIPGNAEFAVYVVAQIIAMLVVWIADDLSAASWVDFFQWTTIGYILSRGIAKASRVLEQ
jgi:hypothetical protein